MFLRLRLLRHFAYDDTFFWSGECRDKEVRLYFIKEIIRNLHELGLLKAENREQAYMINKSSNCITL